MPNTFRSVTGFPTSLQRSKYATNNRVRGGSGWPCTPRGRPPSYVAQASLLRVVPRWLERGVPVIRRKFLGAWTNHIPIY